MNYPNKSEDAYKTIGDVAKELGLIDKNLVDYVDEVNGVKLYSPELLKEVEVDIIIIFSDEYFDEIVKEAKALVKKPLKFLKYNQIGGD